MLSRRTESARIALVLSDVVLLASGFALAFFLKTTLVLPDPELSVAVYARLYLIACPFLSLALSACGFYRLAPETLPRERPRSQDILWGGFVCMTVLVLVGFTITPVGPGGTMAPPFSRAITFLFGAFSVLALSASRRLVASVSRRLRGEKGWAARLVVFGMSPSVLKLLNLFDRVPHLNVIVVGIAAEEVPAGVAPALDDSEALALLEQGQVDHVLIEASELGPGRLDAVLRIADREGINVHITSPIFPTNNLVPTWERLDGVPVLGFVSAELPFGARLAKRSFDIVLSAIALVMLSPLMLLITLLIRLESPGRSWFVQKRVGAGGRTFRMYKFRTMRQSAEAVTGPVFATENDPRCTRLGLFLRRWNLDELPQFLNVLQGHMSLVGPRPERPEFVGDFKRTIPRYAHKHWVKPGITGWAQVHGLRGASTSIEERVEHDIYYIENWSLMLDIRILVRTLVHGYMNAT